MVSFFPKPYPDEILYSVITRYHIRCGNTSPKITLQELFNSQTTVATVDLPSNLNNLIQNLQFISNYQVEDFIYKHTLYPLYSPFLPANRSSQILESMKGDYGGDIHTRAGIMASSITMPKYFRFCSTCQEEDLKNYGELYWHRIHQIPGVLVCPFHGEFLQNSLAPLHGFNKHEYYAASTDNCSITREPSIFSTDTLKKLQVLAKDFWWLINSEILSQEPQWFRKQYTNLMIEQGLATATGRIHQTRLLDNFLFFYGREMLSAVDSMVTHNDSSNWVTSIARKHRKSFHPLRHLLMMRFLKTSVEEFFKQDTEYKPFGKSPWLCLNAAAEHYLQPVITNLVITLCSDTKKPVGTFSCSCGMIYCRTGPDETDEDKLRIGKVKAFGQLWEQKLKELVEVEKLGLRETARRLNVDARTIKRYVSLLKLTAYWQARKENSSVDLEEVPKIHPNYAAELKCKHRQNWIALQAQNPEASKTTLRKLAPATYTWLYRNDREWLNQNSPALQVAVPSVARVDWHERDQQILTQVQDRVRSLLNANEPERISISRVGKTIGLLALLEKHLDQMPLTQAYLESVVETVEEFQMRRIKWAIKLLDECGEEIMGWKVVRLAALREDCSEKVNTFLDSELDKALKKDR
ncbi:TniQ family protein [Calothrix sp. FACHB-1219]|uniref:TnsD family Tn7-like transposition protein n=1 Tax=unclassified Calothrix TaxID=2619626 RepID=UPI001682F5B4|nr:MULTISPECIES: TnsD family Tn7-like transposition protein [unclassified Calothrix]MBD2203534.1 TniQ family protein [Calothrix sp. FACHB-168]MBD2221145.1 TniQ family protein [Calothrix sp. FACHB-1219]